MASIQDTPLKVAHQPRKGARADRGAAMTSNQDDRALRNLALLQIAMQLPEDSDAAIAVLEYGGKFVEQFMRDPEPPRLTVVG
jgi:hypothetical protein